MNDEIENEELKEPTRRKITLSLRASVMDEIEQAADESGYATPQQMIYEIIALWYRQRRGEL